MKEEKIKKLMSILNNDPEEEYKPLSTEELCSKLDESAKLFANIALHMSSIKETLLTWEAEKTDKAEKEEK